MATDWEARLANAQEQENYKSWLAMMDAKMDIDFLVFDVADMPDDPYSEEGLRIAERAALNQFSDMKDVVARKNWELADKFIRFVGETLVRSFEGKWVNVPDSDETDAATPQVALPFDDGYINPWTLTTAAMDRRTGDEWAFVYRGQRGNYEKWKTLQD